MWYLQYLCRVLSKYIFDTREISWEGQLSSRHCGANSTSKSLFCPDLHWELFIVFSSPSLSHLSQDCCPSWCQPILSIFWYFIDQIQQIAQQNEEFWRDGRSYRRRFEEVNLIIVWFYLFFSWVVEETCQPYLWLSDLIFSIFVQLLCCIHQESWSWLSLIILSLLNLCRLFCPLCNLQLSFPKFRTVLQWLPRSRHHWRILLI